MVTMEYMVRGLDTSVEHKATLWGLLTFPGKIFNVAYCLLSFFLETTLIFLQG